MFLADVASLIVEEALNYPNEILLQVKEGDELRRYGGDSVALNLLKYCPYSGKVLSLLFFVAHT